MYNGIDCMYVGCVINKADIIEFELKLHTELLISCNEPFLGHAGNIFKTGTAN